MRFRGTGKHPQYPENIVVDLDENDASGATLISEGAIEPLPLDQDPGRTVSQIAASAQRGEFGLGSVSDPVDRAIALREGFIDGLGNAIPDAVLPIVQGDGHVETDGAQPEQVSSFEDQRGAAPDVVAEAAADVAKERADMAKEARAAANEAGQDAGPTPQENLEAQQAESSSAPKKASSSKASSDSSS